MNLAKMVFILLAIQETKAGGSLGVFKINGTRTNECKYSLFKDLFDECSDLQWRCVIRTYDSSFGGGYISVHLVYRASMLVFFLYNIPCLHSILTFADCVVQYCI